MKRRISPIASRGWWPASRMSETTMAELPAMLEEVVGRPVIDESGLDGRYQVEVTGPHESRDAFRAALEREMGLTLTPGRREIEVVVVR